MSISGKIQKRGKSWARKASALVLIAVLNLALQPCVMAMQMDTDRDCPHCPTEISHDHGQATDCSYLDNYNFDSRSTLPKAKDLPLDAPVLVDDIAAFSTFEYPPKMSVRVERCATHLGAPPLNILYCVYLD